MFAFSSSCNGVCSFVAHDGHHMKIASSPTTELLSILMPFLESPVSVVLSSSLSPRINTLCNSRAQEALITLPIFSDQILLLLAQSFPWHSRHRSGRRWTLMKFMAYTWGQNMKNSVSKVISLKSHQIDASQCFNSSRVLEGQFKMLHACQRQNVYNSLLIGLILSHCWN